MRTVPINWTDLEMAVERNAPNTESFLDLRDGEVVTVAESAIDYAEQRAKVQNGGDSAASSTSGWSASSPVSPTSRCASGW